MIQIQDFATTKDGLLVKKYSISNKNGMSVEVINFGGCITSIKVPNANGEATEVNLGYQNPEDYFENPNYFGALIGRYGNRIAGAKFQIDEGFFQLEANNGPNNLHGGTNGFHKKFWEIEVRNEQTLKLSYLSKDGEEGFPGNLSVTIFYELTDENELKISYEATTDKTTVVNLTQHAYFNLSGDFASEILDHELKLNSNYYLPTDESMIPTGEFKLVENSPFDFRDFKYLGKEIESDDLALIQGSGYDHTFYVTGEGLRNFATAKCKSSGITMEVFSTEPGVQLYTGNHIGGGKLNQQGTICSRRSGFCLETQHFPDSPNKPDFPSTVLKPEMKYNSQTLYKFGLMEEA